MEKAVYRLDSHALLTLLASSTQDHLPRDDTGYSRLGPSTSIIHQENTSPDTPTEQSARDNFPVKVSFSLVAQVPVKLTKTSQHTQVTIQG